MKAIGPRSAVYSSYPLRSPSDPAGTPPGRRLGDLSRLLGATLLSFMASILIIAGVFLAFGHQVSSPILPLAVVPPTFTLYSGARRLFSRAALRASLVLLLVLASILVSLVLACGWIYDLSWDGQAYQQEGIIQLSRGWNPFRDAPYEGVHSLWINHYPKGSWIGAASLYTVTGDIEQGKAFNFILILASFLLTLSAFLVFDAARPGRALIFSLLLALNPVSICQSLSYYNDGQLASLLLCLLASGYLLFAGPDLLAGLAFSSTLLLIVNTKFTGIVYAAVYCLGLLAFLLVFRQRRTAGFAVGLAAASFAAGILFLGFNPYVTNLRARHHPFYPIMGPHAVNIMDINRPQNFASLNRFERLLLSLFSRSENVAKSSTGRQTNRYKWPLTFNRDELVVFSSQDTRSGGFGPLFGGAVLLSAMLLLISLVADRRKTALALGVIGVIAASAALNSELWWARYAPQLWTLPILVAVLGLSRGVRRMLGRLSVVLLVLLGLNAFWISGYYLVKHYSLSRVLRNQLGDLRDHSRSVRVDFHDFYSNRLRLQQFGIRYRQDSDLSCPDMVQLIRSDTQVCPIPK